MKKTVEEVSDIKLYLYIYIYNYIGIILTCNRLKHAKCIILFIGNYVLFDTLSILWIWLRTIEIITTDYEYKALHFR
jgi:hypothetical protein